MTINTQGLPQAQINSIIALYSNGQIQEALDSVETLTKNYPNEPLLYNIGGLCFRAISKLDDSVKSFEKALALKPDYTEVHNNLGIVFMELGQYDAAVVHYKKALVIKPDYTEVHNNLGIVFMELGQYDAAVVHYKKALVIKPDYAEALNNLGLTLQELGQLNEAFKSYEKAIAIKPDYAEAHNNLGSALRDLGKLDAAIEHYEKTLVIKPSHFSAYNNLGIVLMELGQHDAAFVHFEKALAIQPDYAEAHNNLGILFKELGQKDEAVKSFEKALSINPEYIIAHRQLSAIKKYTANDPQITQMQSLASTSDLSQSDRMHLCFALAKVYEDLEKQDELFKFLHEGNRLRKQELNYSLDMDQITHSVVKKLFSSCPSIVEKSVYKASKIRPVFILGMPRSGTSLVEQIIASHHAVYGAGELNTLNNLIFPIVKELSTHDTNGLSEETFLSIRQRYLDSLSRFNVTEKVITDKMPINFRWIGFILTAFPEAKIVHLKRDARATCWSIYKRYFSGRGMGFPYNIEDLTRFYGLYTDLMAFWHQLFPDKIYDICYEDLTVNQEEETRKLLEYCELHWDENCLDFHTSKRAVKTVSKFQVRQKMYQGSSEVWKEYKEYLQPLIQALSPY